MPLPILQCIDCRFNVRFKNGKFPFVYICDEYPDSIPEFVEEAIKDCPKFKEKE